MFPRLNSCLNPQVIFRRKGINPLTGKHYTACSVDDLHKWTSFGVEELVVRCGKCYNCLKAKSSSILARSIAEQRCHDDSAFITLTVDDQNLESVFPGSSLVYRPFQLFMKRLRKKSGKLFKFLMCAEYGELSLRPHYHCIVFGLPAFLWNASGVQDNRFSTFYKARVDNPVFQDCWPFGAVYLGSATQASIAYVCGYTLKQFVLHRDFDFYNDRGLAPEFVRWSRRPGLGRSYFEQYGLQLVDGDFMSAGVSVDRRRIWPGRYFSDFLHLNYPQVYDRLFTNESENSFIYEDYEKALDVRERKLAVSLFNDLRKKRL